MSMPKSATRQKPPCTIVVSKDGDHWRICGADVAIDVLIHASDGKGFNPLPLPGFWELGPLDNVCCLASFITALHVKGFHPDEQIEWN